MIHDRRKGRLLLVLLIVLIPLFAAPGFGADQTAVLYSQRCASCHGDSGRGDGPAAKFLKPPPTDFATSLKGKSDDWIARSIKGGGQAVGESPMMPPFGDLLDGQIKALVEYIKHLGH